jgi:hypothetical protein
VRLPSSLRTVTSVRVRSNTASPFSSYWVVTESPLALVVVTDLSSSDPLGFNRETVSTTVPFAWVTMVSCRSLAPSPLRSWAIVTFLRSALMV